MREVKIINNEKMCYAIEVIKDVLCENPRHIGDMMEAIDDNKIEYLGYALTNENKRLLCMALTAMLVLQDCESIQLNFGEGK